MLRACFVLYVIIVHKRVFTETIDQINAIFEFKYPQTIIPKYWIFDFLTRSFFFVFV